MNGCLRLHSRQPPRVFDSMRLVFFSVALLWVVSISADEPTLQVQTANLCATKDSNIVDGLGPNSTGRDDWNFGKVPFSDVGPSIFSGLWRILVSFDFSQLPSDIRNNLKTNSNSDTDLQQQRYFELVTATLQMNVVSARSGPTGDYIPCTVSTPFAVGCPTMHLLNKDWGEGRGGDPVALTNESTWNHNIFPNRWDTPGGDFLPEAIGQSRPDQSTNDGDIMEFDMSVIQLQQSMVARTVDDEFFGFLLRDDNNTGWVRFYARDNTNGRPPQLVLEFNEVIVPPPTSAPASSSPTRSPTQSPTLLPTTTPTRLLTLSPTPQAPTMFPSPATTQTPTATSTSDTTPGNPFSPGNTTTDSENSSNGAVTEACGDFQQDLLVSSRLDTNRLGRLQTAIVTELAALTPAYIGNSVNVDTNVFTSPFRQEDLDSGGTRVLMEYQLCFAVPNDSHDASEVETYPSQFESFMNVPIIRRNFEGQLIEAGNNVIPGSLSGATFLLVAMEGGGSDINTAGIVGGVAAAVMLLLGMFVGVRWYRTREGKAAILQQPHEDNGNSTGNALSDDPTLSYNPHPQRRVPSRPARGNGQETNANSPHEAYGNLESIPYADVAIAPSVNLHYKDQGQSVLEERTVQPQIRPVEVNLHHKDQGQSVLEERTVQPQIRPAR